MSLFRIAIVLSLGVAVMPSEKEKQEELYARAASAAHWTMTYCDRNGTQCEMASHLWDAFLAKAQFAGKMAYDVAIQAAATDEIFDSSGTPIQAKARGTLNPDDLRPQWRGEMGRNGI